MFAEINRTLFLYLMFEKVFLKSNKRTARISNSETGAQRENG